MAEEKTHSPGYRTAASGVAAFWNLSDDEKDAKGSEDVLPSSTNINSRVTNGTPQSGRVTPFNIISETESFENSPSQSLVAVALDQIQLLSNDICYSNIPATSVQDEQLHVDKEFPLPRIVSKHSEQSLSINTRKKNCLKSLINTPEFQRNITPTVCEPLPDLENIYNEIFSPRSTPILQVPDENPRSETSSHTVPDNEAKTPIQSSCSDNVECIEDLSPQVVADDDVLETPMPSPCGDNDIHNFGSDHEENIQPPVSPDVVPLQDEPHDNDENVQIPSKQHPKGRAEWAEIKRKNCKNHGLSYITRAGKEMDAKILGPPCNCKLKCYDKVDEEQRKYIFKQFWKLGDRQKQWNFVLKYTVKQNKKRRYNNDTPDRRLFTYKYLLPLKTTSTIPKSGTVIVCKTMFLNTLNMSDRIVRTAWEKYDGTTEVQEDKRGRHGKHKIVVNEEMTRSVRDHVISFAPVESHYLRKKSTKYYLDGSLNISKMFKLYGEWYDDKKYSCKAKTERQYREIITKNFNLGFHIPKKDQCDDCHAFKNNKTPTEDETAAFANHQKNKTVARNKKTKDKKDAQESNGKLISAVFDFEKVLTCPHGEVSNFYYKRKLACLNFTVFDMDSKKAMCYMWDETVAKRGANEVSSCLLNFIEKHAESGVEEFRFWSDNCGGQNRNRIVFFLYIYACRKYQVTISHSFLEKGHTQNEGDSVHSVIEKASSAKLIYTPDEWKLLVRWAKSDTNNQYVVKNMTKDDFYDFKSHVQDSLWKKDIRNQKVQWNKVREVFVSKDDPDKLLFKYDLSADYRTIVIKKNKTRSGASEIHPVIEKAYSAAIPITDAKYKDLESLCKARIIPEEHATFFRNLPHGNVEYTNTDEDSSEE